jgi:hypothetical protein
MRLTVTTFPALDGGRPKSGAKNQESGGFAT